MSTSTRSGGIGFCGALFILFLGLHLTEHIDWAWYWVAAPLWMPVAAIPAALVVTFIVYGVAELLDYVRARRVRREPTKRGARRG